MKRFIRKRWFGIPVVLLVAVLVLVLAAGGVMAAYTAWTGMADVTVGEAITVALVNTAPTGVVSTWTPGTGSGTLTVASMVAGDCVLLGFRVSNSSTFPLNVTVTVTQIGGTTSFITGTLADRNNLLVLGPVPAYSWLLLADVTNTPAGAGNPIALTVSAGGTEDFGFGFQAGSDIVPGAYTFAITVDR